jgi:hypothetical protein
MAVREFRGIATAARIQKTLPDTEGIAGKRIGCALER